MPCSFIMEYSRARLLGVKQLLAAALIPVNQLFVYEYRVTQVTRSRSGTVDPCQTVAYTYGTNGSASNYGRVVNVVYGTTAQTCVPGAAPSQYGEQYWYNAAGAVVTKEVGITRIWTDWNGNPQTLSSGWRTNMTANYGYDYWGNRTSSTYNGNDPFNSNQTSGFVGFTTTYDTLGRPSGLTEGSINWVQGVQYDLANRMTQLQYPQYGSVFDYMTEQKTYNMNEQLTAMTWTPGAAGQGAPTGSIIYSYTGTGHGGNNGQVVQVSDGVSGETIAYQFDSLKRLTQASSTPQAGTTPTAWTQQFSYDGFGNLTGKSGSLATASIPVNPATNQLTNQSGVLSNVSYDSNGNLLSLTNAVASTGSTMVYDEANRLASVTMSSGGTEYYGYDPSNKRIYKRMSNGTEEWTFYGAMGEKLGTYAWTVNCSDWSDPTSCYYQPTLKTTNVWFAGKLIWTGTAASTSGPAFTDRLGTNRANGARFYPYGDEITATANDREKFGTYQRDSFSGLDYADQRYYASAYGRFNTVDPKAASADPQTPQSWNRYGYVLGDPVNHNDPRGMDEPIFCGDDDCPYDPGDGGGGFDPCDQIINSLLGGTVNCGSPVLPVVPPQEPQQPQQPTCSIELYSRPAFINHNPGKHTYLLVDDPDLTSLGYSSDELMLEGGPSNSLPFGGSLIGFYNPPGQGLAAGKSIASDPALPTNHEIGSAYTGANACSDITGMLAEIQSYNQSPVPYAALPFGVFGTYNSVSVRATPVEGSAKSC